MRTESKTRRTAEWCARYIRYAEADDRDFLRNRKRWRNNPTPPQLRKLDAIKNRLGAELGRTKAQVNEEIDELSDDEAEKTPKNVRKKDDPRLLTRFEAVGTDLRDKRLSHRNRAVMWVLYYRVWMPEDEATPSLAEFCRETGLSKTTVCEALNELDEWGDFFKRDSSTGGRNKRTVYSEIVARAIERQRRTVSEKNCSPSPNSIKRDTVRPVRTRSHIASDQDEYIRSSVRATRVRLDDSVSFDSERGRGDRTSDQSSRRSSGSYAGNRRGFGGQGFGSGNGKNRPPPETDYDDDAKPSNWEEWRWEFCPFSELEWDADKDERYNTERLAHRYGFGFDTDAVDMSINRFVKYVKGEPFPGEDNALRRLEKWLSREEIKEF